MRGVLVAPHEHPASGAPTQQTRRGREALVNLHFLGGGPDWTGREPRQGSEDRLARVGPRSGQTQARFSGEVSEHFSGPVPLLTTVDAVCHNGLFVIVGNSSTHAKVWLDWATRAESHGQPHISALVRDPPLNMWT